MARHPTSLLIVTLLWDPPSGVYSGPVQFRYSTGDEDPTPSVWGVCRSGLHDFPVRIKWRSEGGVVREWVAIFAVGDVLHILRPEQVEYIWDLFQDATIQPDGHGQEFVECCDQFFYDIHFEDSQGTSTVRGNSGCLPAFPGRGHRYGSLGCSGVRSP